MSSINIIKVADKKQLEEFIDFHYDLYRGNKYNAPPLFNDEVKTLSKDKNAAFDFCEAEYFLAYKEGKIVGRVAAIINHKANKKWGKDQVRFGWIDFIDDREVSEVLIQAVEDYGKSKGMTEIVGPLGFTDMDPEGMLVEGFDQLGTMPTIYNYPYYPEHFRDRDFVVDNKYVEYKIFVPQGIPEKLDKISKMVQERYHLKLKRLTKRDVFQGGYGKKIFKLVNETYKDLYGFSELSDRQIDQYVSMYFPLADLDWITIIEDTSENNKLVGLGITIPSLTYALQKCHKGRLLPMGWWHLLRAIKWHKTDIADLLLIGVLPEYRQKGVTSLIFTHLIPIYNKYGIKWGESQVEMETNANVRNQWEHFESVIHKRRECYKRIIK